ncbi:hypothetical protein HC733_20905 [Pseudoalteromonas sp. S16_S37]|nr:hypothetical protein [Pseudoalteromonas sp. S16_S37]
MFSSTAFATSGGGDKTLSPIKSLAQWKEADFVEFHCRGEIEHRLSDKTRIDCLNDDYAIEYDWGKKWAEAIGQALYYSAMTGKKAGIVLIVNTATKERYLRRIEKTIETHKLKIIVWTVNKDDKKPPVRFL